GDDFYTFPSPQKLANLTAEDLAPLKAGFRAKYLIDAAKKVSSGVVDLSSLHKHRDAFVRKKLMQISGIGPKVALGIIGAITPARLCQAIQKKQASVLVKLPGVGKKSAERMIVELKDKLHFADAGVDGQVEDLSDLFALPEIGEGVVAEAAAALQSLGYNAQQLAPVLEKCSRLKGDQDVQSVIKFALKELSGR
ncbi:Holliday junction branch migration protein RuvA, partial [Anaerovibrio slackiae]|uniref:Holliday junction branch migration protein RuvA n=1 Tax=Anaerovibrio slackiae TaxID=2652309 RepID=UPI003864033D